MGISVIFAFTDYHWLENLKTNDFLLSLMMLNLFLFFVRLVQRMRFTTKLYGIKHGLMIFPRLIIGSVINGLAAIKALRQFGQAAQKNETSKIEWDKTQHFFPTEEELNQAGNLQ